MSDVRGTVLDAIVDAVTGRASTATVFAALVAAGFLLGAHVLATHRHVTASSLSVVAVAATATLLAGCASTGSGPSAPAAEGGTVTSAASESNPPGDIPDTQAYVPFTPPGGLFTVSVPEGWARSTDGAVTIFTDMANTVRIQTTARVDAPNTESVKVDELPAIASSTAGYRPATVTAVQRNAGPVIVITYRGNSAPNPVTGKTGTDVFERYDYWRSGHEVILTLSGPAGADNVDPWRTITDSLRWT